MVDFIKERAKRSAKKKREREEKETTERARKKDKEPEAKTEPPAMIGPGGYGGRSGVESQRRQIEQEERGEEPTTTGVSFKSSNGGGTGRMSATARRARDKRLKGVSI